MFISVSEMRLLSENVCPCMTCLLSISATMVIIVRIVSPVWGNRLIEQLRIEPMTPIGESGILLCLIPFHAAEDCAICSSNPASEKQSPSTSKLSDLTVRLVVHDSSVRSII